MPLSARTWTDVAAAGAAGSDGALLCVPVGSCEQHGPHLPLGTDTIVAVHLAEALACRTAGVLVAPPLTVTASGEHAGFPGTLSIGTAAMTAVLVELVRSADWAAGVVFVNGHGGNADAMAAAVDRLRAEGRRVLPWWPRVPGGDAHAGATETSLLLALAPELVRRDAIAAGITAPLGELAPRLRAEGVRAVSPTGVLGDPTAATAAHGHAWFSELVDDLLAAVAGWRAGGR